MTARCTLAYIAWPVAPVAVYALVALIDPQDPTQGRTDHRAEWAHAQALLDAQADAARAARRQAAAQNLCGHQAAVVWIDDATHRCADRRGRVGAVMQASHTPGAAP